MKLKVRHAMNPVLITSNHRPKAALADIVNCQIPLCTSCKLSNSSDNSSCMSRARIVDKPLIVAVRWLNTGLRATNKKI